MIKDLISFLENKKVLILGFGREGKSTYNFIRKYLNDKKIYIADMQEDLLEKNEILKKDNNIECICGKDYLNGLENYDIIIKTPGIAFVNMDITRYNKESLEYKEWHDYVDEIGMRYYGFLTSENRLCVALSRQKKLLIVVGDSTIFRKGNWGSIAKQCVPALKNFYELCDMKGAVINVET